MNTSACGIYTPKEKAELVTEGWSVELETEQPPMAEGARVRTRAKDPANQRRGKITGKSEDGTKWLVRFDDMDEDNNDEERSPQSLAQIFVPEIYK